MQPVHGEYGRDVGQHTCQTNMTHDLPRLITRMSAHSSRFLAVTLGRRSHGSRLAAGASLSPRPERNVTVLRAWFYYRHHPRATVMYASLKSVESQADAERNARVDLAACYRLSAHFGLNEGIDNHLTLLVPVYSDRFLLAPFGLHWSEVRASDFMVIDFNGRIVSGRGPIEDTALYIHLPVHRLSPQARCVLHTHMPYATALCMLENPRLEMAGQSAVGFYGDIADAVDYNGLAFDHTEGERLARALGTKSVLMMRNHGVLVGGQSVAPAFERADFLAGAPPGQVLARATGR